MANSHPAAYRPTSVNIALVAVVAMLVGYIAGTATDTQEVHAQAQPVAATTAIGVSIPSNGAALVRGRDGRGYVVNAKGLVTAARGNGKDLELP